MNNVKKTAILVKRGVPNHHIDSGAHTIGNQDNNNILISFASFENDGSRVKGCKQGVMTPHVKMENVIENIDDDDDLDDQYRNPNTQVKFYSLKDFQTCDDVEEFLDTIRAEISNNSASTSNNTSVKRASLFLQDFPSEGVRKWNVSILF